MRTPGTLMVAARALHDRLIAISLHPPDGALSHDRGEFNRALSPCDGCYDLAAEVIEVYGATWQGLRIEQHPTDVRAALDALDHRGS